MWSLWLLEDMSEEAAVGLAQAELLEHAAGSFIQDVYEVLGYLVYSRKRSDQTGDLQGYCSVAVLWVRDLHTGKDSPTLGFTSALTYLSCRY
jgi:hypothetical protein